MTSSRAAAVTINPPAAEIGRLNLYRVHPCEIARGIDPERALCCGEPLNLPDSRDQQCLMAHTGIRGELAAEIDLGKERRDNRVEAKALTQVVVDPGQDVMDGEAKSPDDPGQTPRFFIGRRWPRSLHR